MLFEIIIFATKTKTKNDITSLFRIAETCSIFRDEIIRLYKKSELRRIENIINWRKVAKICWENSERPDIDEEEANQWELAELACRKQAYLTWGYSFEVKISLFCFNINFIDPFNQVPEIRNNWKFCMECLTFFNIKSDSFFQPRPFDKRCNHFICTKCVLDCSLIHSSNFPTVTMECSICSELHCDYFEITRL